VEDEDIPDGFLRIPDAVAALVRGMYATFQQPKLIHKIKLDHQKARVVFGPWKEHAAERIRTAACDGKLPIYVKGNPDQQPLILLPKVVDRLIMVRGGLPEHPVRPSLKTAHGDARLFKLLSSGLLLIHKRELLVPYNRVSLKNL
jgi:hypothetical protein